MAITYPLSTPTDIGIANIELRARNAVAISQSPFTYATQTHSYSGQLWQATVTIPPVRRDLAEPWIAFLLSLKGPTGTFLLGDPNCKTPRGSASTYFTALVDDLETEAGTVLQTEAGTTIQYEQDALTSLLVDGAGQTGETLNVKGGIGNLTGYLKAGDYIQIGTASSATLHKVLVDADTDANGDMTLDIWPGIRIARADNTTINLSEAVGLFRLSTPQQNWTINDSSIYGVSFEAMEAI